MNFIQLKDFIQNKMRLSHIYQPVMLKTLLMMNGKATVRDIARSILSNDESQIEYYENVTKNMVGRVLTNHNVVSKDKDVYSLNSFDELSKENIDELLRLCNEKLKNYIDKRGEKIWQHRKKSSGYISGTKRYNVFKAAKFHCELCGVAGDERGLEVDHIVPRDWGGSDEEINLQALCYTCNSMKGNRDDTDFRAVRKSFEIREPNCLFCKITKDKMFKDNKLAFAILDKYPITEMHTLIIPKRHEKDYFQLGRSEINACNQLLVDLKDYIVSKDKRVDGFNIGINNGEIAGQSINHCHIHLIPRRKYDVDRPKGGIRHLIPGKGEY